MATYRIFLHANLKKLGGAEPITLDAASAAEAISGLQRARKGLFKSNLIDGRPVIKILNHDSIESLKAIRGPDEDIELHVWPRFSGGKSGFISLLVGAVLIAAAFAFPEALGAIGGEGSLFGAAVANTPFLIGAGLVIGGLTQVLFPVKISDQQLSENNYLGTGGVNSVTVGTRIPLLFGTMGNVGGQILSWDVVAKNLND